MWLQKRNYEFTPLEGEKLKVKQISQSKLIINEIPTEIPLKELFKGPVSEKPDSIRGYSILELLNEEGKIDIDGNIYELRFINEDVKFKLLKFKDVFSMGVRELTDKDAIKLKDMFTEALKKSPEEKAPTPALEVKVEQPLPLEPSQKEEGPTLFQSEAYEKEKAEMLADGYKEYNTSPVSNLKALSNGDITEVIVLEKDSYSVLDDQEVNLNEENMTFELVNEKVVDAN